MQPLRLPSPLQVRAVRAQKLAPPPVAAVPLAAAEAAAQQPAPVGASWFWGSAGAGGAAGGSQVPLYPDAEDLKPLYQHLPFRQAGSSGGQ